MYSRSERTELKEISKRLMDSESIGHAERMIVDAVIQDCKDRGESLEKRLQDFMAEGRAVPH